MSASNLVAPAYDSPEAEETAMIPDAERLIAGNA